VIVQSVSPAAERSRAFHTRRRAALEAVQRDAYKARRAEIARAKVGTLPHFKKWASLHRLDNGKKVTLEKFQLDFVGDLFLGKPVNWFILPEGNAKTTLIALLAKYCLEFYFDAKVPVGASSRDQAGLTYDQLEGFIVRARDDGIPGSDGFELHPGYRTINYLPTRSELKVYAADDKTGDGVIPYPIALLDELHRHRDLRLYRTWRGKLDKRGAQLIVISTAGEPGSEFEQTRERIRQDAGAIRKGTFVRAVTPTIVFHEWAVPEAANVEDLTLVKAANPLKAISVTKLRAKLNEPGMTLTHWQRFTCNISTRSTSAAISEAEWRAALSTEAIPEGVPIWLGLDLGWVHDTTALVPLWKRDGEYVLLGPATILTPPRDGSMLDSTLVEQALLAIHARNPIHTIVMDTSFGANVLATFIAQNLGSDVVGRGQTMPQQVEEYERFMEGLREGWLHHSGDAGLTAHAMNAIARVNRLGATVFDRPAPSRTTSSSEQDRRVVDALDAAAMVHAQAMVEVPKVEAFFSYA
jgi:phage terminase large subunit-like protein